MIPTALTIAGSDPSGGAGLQADLKVFQQFGVHGTSVVSALTVQNSRRVDAIEPVSRELVESQLCAVVDDMPPAAAKTGALGSAGAVETVAAWAERAECPLVVDPVAAASVGSELLSEAGRRALVDRLIPACALVTPNLPEAEALSGLAVGTIEEMERAAERIAGLGAGAVLVKGGHLPADQPAVDLLWTSAGSELLEAPRVASADVHGTGCALSAAVTAELAKGAGLRTAVIRAKSYIARAIGARRKLGAGAPLLDFRQPAGGSD